ncbi:MAG: tRNA pseudouridine synthase A, partial [Clostridia bacterium]|nr:tRNA pseudouridine synthase A [Clostridia bacterium]
GELERAAERVFGSRTKVCGSGRTDAGVHALGQVCHLDGETKIPAKKLKDCLNGFLPPDLRVLKSMEAPAGFDCTRGAKKKTYCYSFYYSETEQPLLSRYHARVKQEPQLGLMQAAAKLLVGEHDFKAFCASGSSAKTSVRTVFSAEAEREEFGTAAVYRITVCGNGFLYNMVRILAGEIFAVGCGKPEGITAAFASGKRSCLARTMPACGLVMKEVNYGVPLFGSSEE